MVEVLVRKEHASGESVLTGAAESSIILARAGANKSLEAAGRRLGLDKAVTGNPSQQGEVPRTTLASTVEALIGAVWKDSGNNFDQVQAAIRALGVFEGGGE